MLVNNFLEESARKYPDKIALITPDGRYTYREIDEMANKIISILKYDTLQKTLQVNGGKEASNITWLKAAEKVCSIYKSLTPNFA